MIRKVVLVLCVFLGSTGAWAQAPTYAYSDSQLRWSEVDCHVEGGMVRKGNNWRGKVEYTVRGEKIFAGFSSSSFDLAYTLRDGKLSIGDSFFTDAISYSMVENRIYVGDSYFPLDLAYTISPDGMNRGVMCVYKGDSISPFDVVAYLQGVPTQTEIIALLLTMGLL
jgi:hypothetical protein|tara:strand:+ start:1207 stop:1707 length:501 start_codon:yes stop_codon:yes gene_type:complete